MRRNNRKGFTIVELVIVIAVIAILAAVLIPTFAGIVSKANKSAALQEAQAAYKEIYAVDVSDGELDGEFGQTTVSNDALAAEGITIAGTLTTYAPNATENAEKFKYTAKNGYVVKLVGTTWDAEKPTT